MELRERERERERGGGFSVGSEDLAELPEGAYNVSSETTCWHYADVKMLFLLFFIIQFYCYYIFCVAPLNRVLLN